MRACQVKTMIFFFCMYMFFLNFHVILGYSWLTVVIFRCTAKSVIHVSILFQIVFPLRLLWSIEQSSPCYSVGSCWLSLLNIAVCTFSPKLPVYLSPLPSPLVIISSFSKSVCLCFVNKFNYIIFLDSAYKWYMSFSVWLASFSIIISRSTHVAANGIISFLFMDE